MTIEELATEASDMENFSHEGVVVVRLPEDGSVYEVERAHYNKETKQLVITVE